MIKKVNVHSKDDGNVFLSTKRRDVIVNILKNSNWKKVFDDGYLLIFNNGYREDFGKSILISCHIDTAFKEGDYFINFFNGGKKLVGTLDNSASIAILLDVMLSGALYKNTFVTFTGDEEGEMRGASKTAEFLKRKLPKVFRELVSVIVMDVTLENYSKSVSLENFFFNKNKYLEGKFPFNSLSSFIEIICNVLRDKNISFGFVSESEADPDESWEYDEYNLNVFSLCLPTKGEDCHSKKGITTTVDKMSHLKNALISIVNFLLS